MVHPVSNFIVSYFYWLFLAILVVNLTQRRHRAKAQRKRFATLYIAILVFVAYIYAFTLIRFNLSDWLLLIYVVVAGVLIGVYRRAFLPFSLHCVSCGTTLAFDRVIYADNNLCADCEAKASEAADGEPPPSAPD